MTTQAKTQGAKALLAEFIGSAALVGGCAYILRKYSDTLNGIIVSSLVCGAIVAAVIYTLDKYSGGHANPMVSLGFAASGRMSWGLAAGYIIAQLLGGVVALIAAAYFTGGFDELEESNAGSLFDADNIKLVIVSALMTMIFVGGFLLVTGNPYIASAGGLAIGLIFAITMLLGYTYAGDTLVPTYALFSRGGNWAGKAYVILGGVIGSLIAALVWRVFNAKPWRKLMRDDCGNAVKDACGNKMYEVCHERVDKCGNVIMDDCGKPSTYTTIDIDYKKMDQRQRNVPTSAFQYFQQKTGLGAEAVGTMAHDGIKRGLNHMM